METLQRSATTAPKLQPSAATRAWLTFLIRGTAQGHFMEKRNLTNAEKVGIFSSFHSETKLLSSADLLVGTGGATFTQLIFNAMVGTSGVMPPYIMVDGHHLIY